MHVKYIRNGTRAPEGWDYFRVSPTDSATFVLTGERAPRGHQPLGPTSYETQETAIAAGIAWATTEGANIVYAEIL